MSHLDDVEALLDAVAQDTTKPETLLNGSNRNHGSTNGNGHLRNGINETNGTNGKAHTPVDGVENGAGDSPSYERRREAKDRGDLAERERERTRERDRADREQADRDRDRRRRGGDDRLLDRDLAETDRGSRGDGPASPTRSDAASSHRSYRSYRSSRHRSRSYERDRDQGRDRGREPRRRRRNRNRGNGGGGGGGGGRSWSRSRSPNRYYRPRDSRRDHERSRNRGDGSRDRNHYGRDRSRERRRRSVSPLAVGDRDSRTVFVQQLAARLRTRELKEFFEKAGPVAEAQIVKDRVSNRSKGVGYVEFKSEDTIAAALQLTGQKLLGIPVIVQVTEAEKNRLARNTAEAAAANTKSGSAPFHRLYVGNIHFSITEPDLRNVFEPFGELEFVQLQKDDSGRSRGYGFVQFRDSDQAREALDKMNGFDLAGRPIRVGLGNDKLASESTAQLMQRSQGRDQQSNGRSGGNNSGSASGGGGSGTFDRAGARDNDKGSGAGALDDTDVAGVNFNNYSRDALMRKLARSDDVLNPTPAALAVGGSHGGAPLGTAPGSDAADQQRGPILQPRTDALKSLALVGSNVTMASRCIVLHNMFDADEEDGENWVKELEDDVRQEAEEKYGHVVHVALDPNSKGDIYLKFDKVQGGENAIKGLNGRYFGGRMITAAPVVDAVYSSLFSRTKAF